MTSRSPPSFDVTSTGDAPKSKSGPSLSGQFGLPPPQLRMNASSGVNWLVQRTAPVSRSNAMIASLVAAAGSV